MQARLNGEAVNKDELRIKTVAEDDTDEDEDEDDEDDDLDDDEDMEE